MPITNPPTPAEECQKMDPKAVLLAGVLDETTGEHVPDQYVPVACCLTGFTRPRIAKTTVREEDCLNFDCDNPDAQENCSGPAESTPGESEESTISAEVNDYPGVGTTTEWFENQVRCCTRRPWKVCYANGTVQIVECAWVQSYEPQEMTPGGGKAKADLTLALCGDFYYE